MCALKSCLNTTYFCANAKFLTIITYQQSWRGHGKGEASSGIAYISSTDALHSWTGSPWCSRDPQRWRSCCSSNVLQGQLSSCRSFSRRGRTLHRLHAPLKTVPFLERLMWLSSKKKSKEISMLMQKNSLPTSYREVIPANFSLT